MLTIENYQEELKLKRAIAKTKMVDLELMFKDDEIFFKISRHVAHELYCMDMLDYEKRKDDLVLSATEVLFNENCGDSLDKCMKIASYIEQTICSGAYDCEDPEDEAKFICLLAYKFYIYKYSKLKTIEDIKEPLPVEIVCNVLNKTASKSNIEIKINDNSSTLTAGILYKILPKKPQPGTPYLLAIIKVISKGEDGYVCGKQYIRLPYVHKAQTLEDLGICELSFNDKITLSVRGAKYVKYTKEPTFCAYNGFAYYFDRGEDIRTHITGRIMLDIKTTREQNSYIDDSWYVGESFDPDIEIGKTVPTELLWMCVSEVYGFSFNRKFYCKFNINNVSDIVFHEDAFADLQIDQRYKNIFLTVLTNDIPSLDAIEGKGQGNIFLLYGKPGVGKTMTAESVAEFLRKPLYYVSVGELGITPQNLEHALDNVLKIASTWDAIVLLDEVDVFAMDRKDTSVERNAMTAILLRTLEKFDGIMFMTTNLLENLDPAFISRSTAVIRYPELNNETRASIWNGLLDKVELSNVVTVNEEVRANVSEYGKYNLNGRVIKNTVRIAYSFALMNEDKVMTHKNVVDALDLLDPISKGNSCDLLTIENTLGVSHIKAPICNL